VFFHELSTAGKFSIEVMYEDNTTVLLRAKHSKYGVIVVKTSRCVYNALMELAKLAEIKKTSSIEDLVRKRVNECLEDKATRGLLREIEAINNIGSHRYIAETYSTSFMGLPAIVRKYYPWSLEELVEYRRKRFTRREAVDLLIKVGEALSYIHSRGYAHGDVKPSNILIDERGEPKLTDFTVAQRIGGNNCVVATGFTPAFAAPEQLEQNLLCYSSDVYALASLYIYMVYGKTPRSVDVNKLKVPRAIERALAEEPSKRPTIDEFIDMLEDLVREKRFYLESATHMYELNPKRGEYIVGRGDDCDIVIKDDYISEHHCKLIYDEVENTWKIVDLRSLNGTVIERSGNMIVVFIGRRVEESDYYADLAKEMGMGSIEEYLKNGDKILLAYSFKTRRARIEFKYVER